MEIAGQRKPSGNMREALLTDFCTSRVPPSAGKAPAARDNSNDTITVVLGSTDKIGTPEHGDSSCRQPSKTPKPRNKQSKFWDYGNRLAAVNPGSMRNLGHFREITL